MKGITVTLYERTQTGTDELNNPTYTETATSIDNVLVAPVSSTELTEIYNLTGRKAVYQLAIPKGDAHGWTAGHRVDFFGQSWRIIAMPEEGIEQLIPLSWNKKVKVEIYEQGDRLQAGSSGSEQTDEESGNAGNTGSEGSSGSSSS